MAAGLWFKIDGDDSRKSVMLKWLKQTKPSDDGVDHYGRGMQLVEEGSFAEAIVELKQAVKAAPDSADSQMALGSVYVTLEQWRDARKTYERALQIDPNLIKAYKQLGTIYDHEGNFIDAIKMLTRAITLDSRDDELRNDLGQVYFNMGSYAEATKAFRQALQINPNSARAHYFLGLTYIDLRDRRSALAEHQDLKSIGRDDLAWTLLDKIQKEL